MTTTLLTNVTDGVATLVLNRPDALNALNAELRGALVDTMAELDARKDVRVIVLTGKGRAFSAGLDVKEIGASGDDVAKSVDATDLGAAIAGLNTPIIAAINGLAVTGGFEITLCCDIVIAAESAWFRDSHAEIGLLPGWGLSQRLARTIGLPRAKEISLTARKVSAREAADLGFVTRVVPDAELAQEAHRLAHEIARWDGRVTRGLKSLIDRGYDLPFAEAVVYERQRSKDFNAAVHLDTEENEPQ
jgi:enoyl-CoA hydratase/carnithine racemase